MRILGLVLAACLFAVPALAGEHGGRVFPPDDCSAGSPFMGFTGVDGSNTFCNSGQDIFANALPHCLDDQYVVKQEGVFVCVDKPITTPTLPVCGDNQVITSNGTSFICVDQTVPGPAGLGIIFDSGWVPINAITVNIPSSVNLNGFHGVIAQIKNSSSSDITVINATDVQYFEQSGSAPNKSQRIGWSTTVQPNGLVFKLFYSDYGLAPAVPLGPNGIAYFGANGYGVPDGTYQIRFIVF